MSENREFTILATRLSTLKRAVERVNKQARKLGLEEASYEVLEEYMDSFTDPDTGSKYLLRLAKVSVKDIDPPKIPGWQFLGRVANEDGIIQINSFDQDNPIPTSYREPDWKLCDHCHVRHTRKYLYVVKNEKTGELKQVGQSCLDDFTGHPNAEAAYRNKVSFLLNIEALTDLDSDPIPSVGIRSYDSRVVLALAAQSVSKYGWVSRSMHYENPETPATADEVEQVIHKPYVVNNLHKDFYTEADKVLEWVRDTLAEKEDQNEYEHNLVQVLQHDLIPYKKIGIAVSAISAYHRWKEAQEKSQNKVVSEWIGAEKERLTLNVKLVFRTSFETVYGTQFLSKMVDDQGHVFVWKGSRSLQFEDEDGPRRIVEGEWVQIKGTVKGHNEYKGEKQTLLKNVKEQNLL